MRKCQWCQETLSPRARADARFCLTRCRVAAHRSRKLPAELTDRTRWVRHDRRKVPLTLAGRAASSTNPRTWATYAEVSSSTIGAGLGFVLGDGIGCIDLDHCIIEGDVLDGWAADLLASLPATYIEVSPSGTGLHVWGFIPERPGRKVRDGRAIETYSTGRYITITGRRWGNCPSTLADLSHFTA